MPKVQKVVRFRSNINKDTISKHDYFDFKNLSITQVIGVILIVLTLIGTIAYTIVQSINNYGKVGSTVVSQDEHVFKFNDDWTVVYNNTGEELIGKSLKSYKIKAKEKQNEGVTLIKEMPDNASHYESIGFVIKNATFNAYVDFNDDGIIDESTEYVGTTHYYHGENNYIGTYWDYVNISNSMAGHKLYIKLTSNSNMAAFVKSFNYGHLPATYYTYYRTIVLQFFLSFGLFFFCVILLFVSYINQISRKEAPQLAVVSLFGVFFSLYILFNCGYLQILTGNTFIFRTLAYLCLSLSGWLLSFYLYLKAQSMRFLRFARILIWYFILLSIGIFASSFSKKFELSFFSPMTISGIYAICVASVFNSVEEIKRNSINTVFLVQTILFLICVTVSGIMQTFQEVNYSNIVMLIGVMFLTICSLTFEYQFNVLRSNNIMKQRQEEQDTKVAIMLAQIQPHFLYNSLNSIAILCEVNPKQAHDLTIKFAQYLRNNIDALSKDSPILFRTELRSIKNYLEIEKIRFSDKLNIVENIQVSDFYVPVLTIQPLVENAVKHGISKKATPGVLMLTTSQDTNNYYVIIEDNGVGFDSSILDIKEKLGKSIGISNVKYRLKSMVGGDVKIESTIGKGTKVTVTLPKVLNQSFDDGGND